MRLVYGSLLAAVAVMAGALAAVAAERPVVVELFTSQGCASCPPADEFFRQLAARDDVVALALHVDYWDYIGWEDTFGSPENTARQRGYAKAGDRKMVYTPQMIVNGADHVVGARPTDVTDVIDRHLAQGRAGSDIAVEVARDGSTIHIQAQASAPREMPLMVQLVRYIPEETVVIERGENAGRTVTYANIVTEMAHLAEWDSRRPLDLKVEVTGDQPAVILLQYPDYGTIEAVAQLR